jgi:hypothetical protein
LSLRQKETALLAIGVRKRTLAGPLVRPSFSLENDQLTDANRTFTLLNDQCNRLCEKILELGAE